MGKFKKLRKALHTLGRGKKITFEPQISTQGEMRKNRRRYPRHAITKESLFIASLNSVKNASVRNISKSGLAFEHFGGAGDPGDWSLIDIFMGGRNPFYLPKIKCRLIYDIAELSENSTFSGSEVRVCGLQFGSLRNEHNKKLVKLINSKATMPIPSSTPEYGRKTKLTKSNYGL